MTSWLTLLDFMQALPMLQHADASSLQPLQPQPAAIPPPHAALPGIAAAYFLDEPNVEMPTHMPAHPLSMSWTDS